MRSTVRFRSWLMLLLLMLLLMIPCCSAYMRIADSRPPQHGDAQITTHHMGRRFGWVVNWLNDRGPVGQVIANLVVALFVFPPLGPIVCSILENCDSARALDHAGSRYVHEDYIQVLESLGV